MIGVKKIKFISNTIITTLLLFASQLVFPQSGAADFTRKAYYAAFNSENINTIQQQLNILAQSAHPQKDAFEGALMMKKAGLIKGASEKLKEFKAGREKLENMIKNNTGNAEYRFLRLVIQEKAPKMLHYDKQLEEDRQYLNEHFNSVSKNVQKIILEYNKSSKFLSLQDF